MREYSQGEMMLSKKIKITEPFLTRSMISNPNQNDNAETTQPPKSLNEIKNPRKWTALENGYLMRAV